MTSPQRTLRPRWASPQSGSHVQWRLDTRNLDMQDLVGVRRALRASNDMWRVAGALTHLTKGLGEGIPSAQQECPIAVPVPGGLAALTMVLPMTTVMGGVNPLEGAPLPVQVATVATEATEDLVLQTGQAIQEVLTGQEAAEVAQAALVDLDGQGALEGPEAQAVLVDQAGRVDPEVQVGQEGLVAMDLKLKVLTQGSTPLAGQ